MVQGRIHSLSVSGENNTSASIHWKYDKSQNEFSIHSNEYKTKKLCATPANLCITCFFSEALPLLLKLTAHGVSLTMLSSKIASSTLKVKWQWTFSGSKSRGKGQLLREVFYSPAFPEFQKDDLRSVGQQYHGHFLRHSLGGKQPMVT